MAFQFKTWLKGLFPEYFWRNDTYLDANNKGFFERYIDSFGDEYANEVYPFIRDVLDILDARITPTKYLPYLSKMMGNLPNTGNASIQRKLIAYAVRLWMIKGTIPSYEFI